MFNVTTWQKNKQNPTSYVAFVVPYRNLSLQNRSLSLPPRGEGCREVAFVTITHDALDLIVHGPLAPPHLDRGPHWTGTNPASDIWWPSLETCSNVFTSATLLI